MPFNTKSTPELRSSLIALERILRQLESVGEILQHNQSVIIPILINKFPPWLQNELLRYKDVYVPWQLQILRESLWKVVTHRESIKHTQPAGQQHPFQQRRSQQPPQSSQAGQPLFGTMSNSVKEQSSQPAYQGNLGRTQPTGPCVFCGARHFHDECRKFSTVQARKKKLIESNLCLRCLRPSHPGKPCYPVRSCFHCHKTDHNRVLCHERPKPSNTGVKSAYSGVQEQEDDYEETETEITESFGMASVDSQVTQAEQPTSDTDVNNLGLLTTSAAVSVTANAVLLTAKSMAINTADPGLCSAVVIFLDPGSQRSFVTTSLAKRLKLVTEQEDTLALHTFAAKAPRQVRSRRIQLKVLLKDDSTMVIQAQTLPHLTGNLTKTLSAADLLVMGTIPPDGLAEAAKGVTAVTPDIVIGNDYVWDIILPAERVRLPSGLYLIPSTLGYLVGGVSQTQPQADSAVSLNYVTFSHELLQDDTRQVLADFERFSDIETIGIKDSPYEKDDDRAVQHFNDTVQFRKSEGSDNAQGRYFVKWPVKSQQLDLPTNFALAFGRFKSLCSRLSENPEFLTKYAEIIQEQLNKGIIEEVDEKCAIEPGSTIHYIPHHAVVTPQRVTTKVRIVFDASAKINRQSNSLNDTLYRGQVLLPDLCGILLRFRFYKTPILADLEKAFLQVGLQTADRDMTRFFWLRNPLKPTIDNGNVSIFRFKRVPFGVVSSPFLLCATVKFHLQNEQSAIAAQLLENLYVDNVIVGTDSTEQALHIYSTAKDIFRKASMNLREWVSNDTAFTSSLPSEDHKQCDSVKVLGLTWLLKEDNLKFNHKITETQANVISRRSILSEISSIFDPLGILAPITMTGKVFLQKMWQHSTTWDGPLSDEIQREYQEIRTHLQEITNITVPRLIKLASVQNATYQLHCFVDASQKCYAAAVYLRIQVAETATVYLLFAKTRISPKKAISIPRLELMAMVIGCRAMAFIKEQIHLRITWEQEVLWSDSMICLSWLSSAKPLEQFVSNRVKELNSSAKIQYRYVTTAENPADCATRGMTVAALQKHDLWWQGPVWLKGQVWPEQPVIQSKVLQEQSQSAEDTTDVSSCFATTTEMSPLFDLTRFSSLKKSLRVTTYFLRFLKLTIWDKLSPNTQKKHPKLSTIFLSIANQGSPSAIEIQMVTQVFALHAQRRQLAEIRQALLNNKKHHLIGQLDLQLDAFGLIRCGGRLPQAELAEDTKNPILLPSKDHFANLLIDDVHESLLHTGIQQTLAHIRQKFWLLKGRSRIRQRLHLCTVCRKQNAGPFALPNMPPLPVERVKRARPFSQVGVDYFGPLWVKQGGEKVKVWLCLFTCLIIRAIHLEMVSDMSAAQFLNCLRRFISRRGQPKYIISDNASQFQLTDKTLQRVWNTVTQDPSVTSYVSHQGISWHFITPLAPWKGGVYERLIGVVKQAFKKSIGRKLLTHEQLHTLATEVEGVVNSRPLTFIYNDVNSKLILRPSDFLVTDGMLGTPQLNEDPDTDDPDYLQNPDSADKLIQFWKTTQKQLDAFWNYWSQEYLVSLRERMQSTHPRPRIHSDAEPLIGETVLLKEENVPRGSWKLARIVELITSQDGEIRSAKVKIASGKVVTRPINHLHSLELQNESGGTQNDTPLPTNSSTRSKRSTSKSQMAITLFLLFLCFPTINGSPPTNECKQDMQTKFVESENCVAEGIIVNQIIPEKLINGLPQAYCWIRKNCHPLLLGEGKCGYQCSCPAWADHCSFNKEPIKEARFKSDSDTQQKILKEAKPNICSLQPDKRCAKEPTHTRLNQIMLLDNTTHYVKELTIETIQSYQEEYTCIGNGIPGGSVEYCQQHSCAAEAEKFCFYRSKEKTFFVSELGKLAIQAWGSIPVTVYLPKHPTPPENPNCFACSLTCISSGAELLLEENIGQIEICSIPYCYRISHPRIQEKVLFTPEIGLQDHDFTVKVWSNGYLIKHFGKQCPSQPYCDQIDCYFCKILIKNPQCTPRIVLLIMFVLLYFATLTIWITLKILKGICKCLYYCRRCIQHGRKGKVTKVNHMTPSNKANYTLIQIENSESNDKQSQQQFKPKFALLTTIMLLSLTTAVQGCAEISSLTAKQSTCTAEQNGETTCSITETTRLSLVPQGQQACLLLQDPTGEMAGTLTIEIKHIGIECQTKSEYFTRSFKMATSARKRCSGAGECTEGGCEEIETTTLTPELSKEANSKPGFTYCEASCGGWFCGCVLPTEGCLFWRNYARPSTSTIYEVFSCPTWHYQVQITAYVTNNMKTESNDFKLRPGVSLDWQGLQLTLISVTNPPAPILNTKFLTDGIRTVLVEASPAGQPIPGTIGELQCSTKSKAISFDCFLPHNNCKCQKQEDTTQCQCTDHQLENLFDDTENLVPLQRNGLTVIGKGTDIEVEYDSMTSLELQVTLEGYRIATQRDKNKCSIEVKDFDGCYACITGAKLRYSCKTDFAEALASVVCGSAAFTTLCTSQGVTTTTTLNFPQSNVKELCTVRCPAGTTHFQLSGTLSYVEVERQGNISNLRAKLPPKNPGGNSGFDLPDFVSYWLRGEWKKTLATILLGLVLLIIFVSLTPLLVKAILHLLFMYYSTIFVRKEEKKE